LLDPLLKSTTAQAQAVRPLAALLADQFTQQLRLQSEAEKLAQLAHDEQHRAEVLDQKLRALEAIEISEPGRPPRRPADPVRGDLAK
jgi:hypothetical protein